MKDNVFHRVLSLELLRIYCMFFIVLGHIEGSIHLNFLDGVGFAAQATNALMSALGIGAVNCFVLITGYFLASASGKIKRILNIYIMTTFYLVSISLILYLLGFASGMDIFKSFFPLAPTVCNYWFVNKYLGLLVLQPFLSRLSSNLSKRNYQLLILSLLFLNTTLAFGFPFGGLYGGGFSLMWFICLFFIGGCLKQYYVPMKMETYKLFTILAIAIISYISIIILGIPYIELGYNSVIVLVISVCLFLLFLSIPITKSRFITAVSPHVFGVYLLHTHFLLKEILGSVLIGFIPSNNTIAKSLYLFICVITIFFASVMIDKLRVAFFQWSGIDRGASMLSDCIERVYTKRNNI